MGNLADAGYNDTDATEGGGTFEPLPNDDYTAIIAETEIRPTKSGGSMLNVEYQIAQGDYRGRRIWCNYTIENASEKAKQIGQAQIRDIARACGQDPDVCNHQDLRNVPITVSVVQTYDDYKGRMMNTVKRWRSNESSAVKYDRDAAVSVPRPLPTDDDPFA